MVTGAVNPGGGGGGAFTEEFAVPKDAEEIDVPVLLLLLSVAFGIKTALSWPPAA